MLQVRPSRELTDEQMATAWMMVECLSDLQRGKLVIHFDAVNRYSLPTEPGDLPSWKQDLEREARYLGEIVSPLVVEPMVRWHPCATGFPRRFAFGNLHKRAVGDGAALDRNAVRRILRSVWQSVAARRATADRMFGDLYHMLAGRRRSEIRGRLLRRESRGGARRLHKRTLMPPKEKEAGFPASFFVLRLVGLEHEAHSQTDARPFWNEFGMPYRLVSVSLLARRRRNAPVPFRASM